MKKLSQKAKLVKYLTKNKTITPAQARAKFDVQKMSARVRELRLGGHMIVSTRNRRGEFAYKLGAGTYPTTPAAAA